jgi:hypothetical protein
VATDETLNHHILWAERSRTSSERMIAGVLACRELRVAKLVLVFGNEDPSRVPAAVVAVHRAVIEPTAAAATSRNGA